MSTNLFAYGTLQFPEVIAAVTGRRFTGVPALLSDHARYALRKRCYPGVRPQSGATVEGVLYCDIDARALARLDRFEDPFYRRRRLPVCIGANESVSAEVYIIEPEGFRLFERRSWNLGKFQRRFLKSYLRRCRRGFAAAPAVERAGAERACACPTIALAWRGDVCRRSSADRQVPGRSCRGNVGITTRRGGNVM